VVVDVDGFRELLMVPHAVIATASNPSRATMRIDLNPVVIAYLVS